MKSLRKRAEQKLSPKDEGADIGITAAIDALNESLLERPLAGRLYISNRGTTWVLLRGGLDKFKLSDCPILHHDAQVEIIVFEAE